MQDAFAYGAFCLIFDFPAKNCYTELMDTPKIMNMDWKALGYWPVWENGKKIWVKDESKN